MARRYVRDNRGRFATTGATARGGRLRTASGNKRKAQTMKAATGEPKRGTIQRSTIKTRRTAARQRGDTASVNVPMRGSRGRRLDAEITRNVTQQRTAKRAESRARNAQFKSDQSRAKALRGKYGDQLAKDFAAKSGRKVSEVKATIKGMAPSQQVKLLTKAGREQRAQANLARSADNKNFRRNPKGYATRITAQTAQKIYKTGDVTAGLSVRDMAGKGFRLPRSRR